jgi:phosphomannomutase
VQTKCGHAFIKERMRSENAVYGGEMSAHHYFRDFAYCDSGMIPWLLVTALMSERGQMLSSMVQERVTAYPCSGEINRSVDDARAVMAQVADHYRQQAMKVEDVDGLSMDMGDWRFNLRMSNTEPVVRLNVESRADVALMEEKTAELLALVEG